MSGPSSKKPSVPTLEQRAKAFARVREAHQTETAEDYVEMIADLIEQQGEARISDLADHFGIAQATVSKIIARLNKEGLVVNRPYRSLFLTEEGKTLALRCKKRHEIVYNFLRSLNIKSDTAHLDAEGIEHHVSEETLKAFARHTEQQAKGRK